MIEKITSCALEGIESQKVEVEVNISRGAKFLLVCLPDNAVKESHYRIAAALKNIGYKIPVKEIRYPNQLIDIDGLIIPGGESTTINDLMKRVGFHDEIKEFSLKKPILGTCAGLIMMLSLIHI